MYLYHSKVTAIASAQRTLPMMPLKEYSREEPKLGSMILVGNMAVGSIDEVYPQGKLSPDADTLSKGFPGV